MVFNRFAAFLRRFDRGYARLNAQLEAERGARRRAESLVRRERLSDLIADGAEAPGWDWDIGTGRVAWTSTLYHLLALPEAETPPTRARLMTQIHPHDRAHAAAWLASLVRGVVVPPLGCQLARGDGGTRLTRWEAALEHREDGGLRRIAVTVHDLSHLKAPRRRRSDFAAARLEIEIGALVGAAVFLAEAESESAGVTLSPMVPPGLGAIAGSEAALIETLSGLIIHAVRRTPPQGRVVIRAQGEDAGASIAVTDGGPALELEEIGQHSALGKIRVQIEGMGGALRLAAASHGGLVAALYFPPERVQRVA